MKLFQIIVALSILLASNFSFSLPLRDVEEIEISALNLDAENKQWVETLLGLRTAYRDALKSIHSYDISYGDFGYLGEEGIKERIRNFQTPEYIYANQPYISLINIKRYGSRYLEYREMINHFDGYLAADGTEKLASTKNDSLWTLIEMQHRVFYRNAEINGEKVSSLDGVDFSQEFGEVNVEKPYPNESTKLWDLVNNIDFEEMVGGLIRGTAKLIELERVMYEGTKALSIYVTYPEYDGAYKAVYSLESTDYGQPLYFYQRSGCRNCDIHNRTSIPELEIHNITYLRREMEFNEYIPIPSSFESIHSDMGETMEIHHYFLMDSSFNSIQNEDELKVPIKAEERFGVGNTNVAVSEIPEPYNRFVRIGSEAKIGFAEQTVEELKQRSIAMNPAVTEMITHAKKNNVNMTQVAMGFGAVLMAAGGIVSIRKKK